MFAKVEKIITPKKSKKTKANKTKITTKKETQATPVIVPEPENHPEEDIPYTTIALF